MLLTEKQAALTWCPRTRSRAMEHMGGKTGGGPGPEWQSCIGPKCMAWRWKADPEPGLSAAGSVMTVPTPETWTCEHCKGEAGGCPECDGQGSGKVFAPVGYCGLAGPLEVLR